MRHLKKGNHLGRTASHKKALMRNMAAQVIEYKEIKTTLAKAKELRKYVERMITYGKRGSVHHRRLAFKFLQNKEAVTALFEEIAPAYEDRNGGYTRIIKLGNRKGDNAEMSIIQLVGFEALAEEKKAKEKKEKASKKTDEHKEEVKSKETPKAKEAAEEVVEEKVEEVKEAKAKTKEVKAEETSEAENKKSDVSEDEEKPKES
jgi:large subunit ribosomal protein L17